MKVRDINRITGQVCSEREDTLLSYVHAYFILNSNENIPEFFFKDT